MEHKEFQKVCKELEKYLSDIPNEWEGKEAILSMKESNSRNWRQMEWIGFYFEFLCENLLKEVEFKNEENIFSFGNVDFDGFYKIPWDLKSHATNTSSHKIVINDSEAINEAIKQYGCIGVILALGKVEYNDENRLFQKWHSEIKGGMSEYEKERIKRGAWSRLRKVKLVLEQIAFIKIDKKIVDNSSTFQSGFRNSDGSPRREKLLLDLEILKENENVYFLDFK